MGGGGSCAHARSDHHHRRCSCQLWPSCEPVWGRLNAAPHSRPSPGPSQAHESACSPMQCRAAGVLRTLRRSPARLVTLPGAQTERQRTASPPQRETELSARQSGLASLRSCRRRAHAHPVRLRCARCSIRQQRQPRGPRQSAQLHHPAARTQRGVTYQSPRDESALPCRPDTRSTRRARRTTCGRGVGLLPCPRCRSNQVPTPAVAPCPMPSLGAEGVAALHQVRRGQRGHQQRSQGCPAHNCRRFQAQTQGRAGAQSEPSRCTAPGRAPRASGRASRLPGGAGALLRWLRLARGVGLACCSGSLAPWQLLRRRS